MDGAMEKMTLWITIAALVVALVSIAGFMWLMFRSARTERELEVMRHENEHLKQANDAQRGEIKAQRGDIKALLKVVGDLHPNELAAARNIAE